MAFTEVEMSILAQLAYRDINCKKYSKETLESVLRENRDWLINGEPHKKNDGLGASYEKYVDNLIEKVTNQNYTITGNHSNIYTGFYAYAVKTPQNEVVVACRGTNQLNDAITDAELALTVEANQHKDMEYFVNSLEKQGYMGYYFTGHSLGGNLATHGSTTIDNPDEVKGVYTYNAPGFNEEYWKLNGWKLREIDNIVNFQNEYDYVSSILRSPGENVIIDSNLPWYSHAGFGDHSINAYQINEDGRFGRNTSGRKGVLTSLGTVAGEAGQSLGFGWENVLAARVYNLITYGNKGNKGALNLTRDFSDDSKQKMLQMVEQVESEKWCNLTDWIGDRWYDFETVIGNLNIRRYIDEVNEYHKKVIDKNNTTRKEIERIFNDVRTVDSNYAKNVASVTSTLSEYLKFIDALADTVEPNRGRFNGEYMTISLSPIVADISVAEIRTKREHFLISPARRKAYDVDLVLDYIRRDPETLSDEEKKAVLEVIEDIRDSEAFFEHSKIIGNGRFEDAYQNLSAKTMETNGIGTSNGTNPDYNGSYEKVLDEILAQGEESNTFAAEILRACNGDGEISANGKELSANIKTLFGSISFAEYAAKWKSENTEKYIGKKEVKYEDGGLKGSNLENLNEKLSDKIEGINDNLEKNGLRKTKEKNTYYDENGNRIDEKKGKEAVDQGKKTEFDIYTRKKEIGYTKYEEKGKFLGGDYSYDIGKAEGYAEFSAGFYTATEDGKRIFSPQIKGEIGGSASVLDLEYENQVLGNEMLGLNVEGDVTALSASAKATGEISFVGVDENGKVKFDPTVNLGMEAEAVLFEAEGSVGVNVLGMEGEVKAGVKVGVGFEADVGFKDGVIKCELGIAAGLGFELGFEVDVSGVVDVASSAWEGLKNWWPW